MAKALVSLMSAPVKDFLEYAKENELHPSEVNVLDVFSQLAERDSSRGGGKLKTDDLLILELTSTNFKTLQDVLEAAKKIIPPRPSTRHSYNQHC